MTNKQKPPVDWKRVLALPYNPLFRDEVKECRKSLGLPVEGISSAKKAEEWIDKHFGATQHAGEEDPFRGSLLPHEMDLGTAWSADPSTIPPRIRARIQEMKPWEVDVPLVRYSAALAYRFRVPLRMTTAIMRYVLADDCESLQAWGGLEVTFETTKARVPELNVTVKGINAWTTKAEWISAWEDVRLKQAIMRDAEGVHPKGKRVGRDETLRERMKLHAGWYELVVQKGLSAAKAVEEWEKLHLDKTGSGEYYDASTVAKSVAEFRRLIQPRKLPDES